MKRNLGQRSKQPKTAVELLAEQESAKKKQKKKTGTKAPAKDGE